MKYNPGNYFRHRSMLMKMAWRNLRQHRVKSLIIGIIMTVSVYVIVVGLTTINTIESGINKAFIDYFTGDVFIRANADYKYSLLGVQSPGGFEDNPVLPSYKDVTAFLDTHPNVASYTPYITGAARLSFSKQEQNGQRGGSFLIGVDPETYYDSFPDAAAMVIEGEPLKKDERGIILSKSNVEEMKEFLKTDIQVGDEVTLYGFGNGGFSIRTVPLRGIFEFVQGKKEKNYLGFLDGETFRDLKGLYFVNEAFIIPENQSDLLEMDLDFEDEESIDDFFEDDFIIEDIESISSVAETKIVSKEDNTSQPEEAKDNDIWEFLIIQLKNPAFDKAFLRDMNNWLEENGIEAGAGDWKDAAFPMSTMADAIRIIFMIVVGIVFFIAVMIVINTLVVSVLERIAEIGTMRALGAQKRLIRKLFNYEVFLLSSISGLTGIALGGITILIVKACHIEANNGLTYILFSGNYLNPVPDFFTLFGPMIAVILAGFAANLYPLHVAGGIEPVEAMREE